MGNIFISYSRTQYYFAESLAFALQAQGLDVWFDAYRLEPGCDWQQTIHDGLHDATALILVASRDSLSSPYCTSECRDALARNVPVYLVLFEAVELPPELSRVSVFDLRGRFNKRIPLLTHLIRTKTPYRDPVPRTNRFNFPSAMPPGIWLPFLVLASSTAALAGFFIYNLFTLLLPTLGQLLSYLQRGNSPALTYQLLITMIVPVVLVISLTLQIHFIWRFTMRKPYYYRTFLSVLFLAPTTVSYQILHIISNLKGSSELTLGNLIILIGSLIVTISLMIVLVYFFIEISGRTGVLLRWLPTGRAPEWLRRRSNKRWIKQFIATRPQAPREQRYYHLIYTPADSRIADEIRAELTRYGYLFVTYPTTDATAVLIISRHSSYSWFQQQIALATKTPICVVTSSIVVPHDPKFRHFQWLDYRSHERDQLLASWNPQQLIWGRKTILPLLPENITSYKVPEKLFIPLYLFGNAINAMLTITLTLLIIGIFLYPDDTTPLVIGILAIISFAGLLWIVSKVWVEDITPAHTIMLLILYFAGNAVMWAIVSPYFAIAPAVILVIFFILLPFTWRALHRWLPTQIPSELPEYERRLAPPAFQLVGSFLGLFIVIGLWGAYQYSIGISALPIAPNEVYTAPAPGIGCDTGPGLWAEQSNESFTVSCDGTGLTIQQTAPSDSPFIEAFQSTRIFPMSFSSSFRAEVAIQISSNSNQALAAIGFSNGDAIQFCAASSTTGRIAFEVNAHNSQLSCQLNSAATSLELAQKSPLGIVLIYQDSVNSTVTFSDFSYQPLSDTTQ